MEKIEPDQIFTCLKCGDCCKGYGGTFLSRQDIMNIAEYIGENTNRFVKKYCAFSGKKPVLVQGESGYCVFWNKNTHCAIHPVKPRMCGAWPFLKSVLVDINNWKIMGNSCPGIKKDAPAEIIKQCIEENLI